MKGKLVLIIGPSGVGKSVILQALKEKRTDAHFPRSATTRERRSGEGDSLYRFVSDETFDDLVKKGEILEFAVVHGKERYGTLIGEIIPYIEKGGIVIREVDVQGFESIRGHRLFSGADGPYRLQSIFILPENMNQLVAHIRLRAPIGNEELERRIASMEKEIAHAENCDARVVNKEGGLADTVSEVERTIFGGR